MSSGISAGASPAAADRFLRVNGLRLHYIDWGTSGKPPLILLHGIARTAHNFDHLAPHFIDRFHVRAVDMRGHGDSEWHPDGALRATLPQARIITIPALGHYPSDEEPERFLEIVDQFLARALQT